MVSKSNKEEIMDDLLQVLIELDTDPKPILQGTIRELRGTLQCIDLEGTKEIDVVLLLSKLNLFRADIKHLYRLDYALRGDIKGILPGQRITQTKLNLKGFFKKKIEEVKWILPAERSAEIYRYTLNMEGMPPQPGEIWVDGPHQTLADKLNRNRDLHVKIVTYLKDKDGSNFQFTIFSDKWGESLRLAGNMWLNPVEMMEIYASKTYLEIVAEIFGYLKEVRRSFGGLTF